MNRISFFFFFLFISFSAFSQSGGEIKGTIKDASTNETIVGASVMYAEGKGAVTDIDGNFTIKTDSVGEYELTVSYVGYTAQKIKVKVAGKPVSLNFSLSSSTLNEVEVVADVAKTRETPIAFSNVSQKQIEEEIGTRDVTMVLNSTPGAYATEQGGGMGDSRVNIRGFDQRNVAVMVDGVPVNDMENGQVYWSNWAGLSDVTQIMQVQRGLGASKLAIPSVGGTMNIITKGIDQKMSAHIKEQVSDYGLMKTSFGFNTGQLKGGWGVTLAGSRTYGNGWVDGTFSDAWSYFAKVQKRFKKHLFSISASGAPQAHGQRYTLLPIGIYSKSLSDKLGINTDSIYKHYPNTSQPLGEHGMRYNPNWGYLDGDGGTSSSNIGFFPKTEHGNVFNERVNYFHKPQFNFTHFWSPNDKLTVSNVVYLSIGHGGGTSLRSPVGRDNSTGLLSPQGTYDYNSTNFQSQYSATENASNNYLKSANNDHIWYGIISSWNYKANKNLSTLFGIDARSYKGTHYQSVYNLMGGDYSLDGSDLNQPIGSYQGDPNSKYAMKREGDKIGYYNDAKVYWGGLFAQAEYKKNKWTTFLTGSYSETGYQRIDYYLKKDLVIDGNTYAQTVGYGDVFYYNGHDHLVALRNTIVSVNGDTTFVGTGVNRKYILNAKAYTGNSAEARNSKTDVKWFSGYTVKGGANYNITDNHSVFVNLGYLSMAPRMNVVFTNTNTVFQNIKNQYVYAVEAGYGLKERLFAVNFNLYYTIWQNKPQDYPVSKQTPNGIVTYNITGLNALHKGLEIDFVFKPIKQIEVEGSASLGDWKYTSAAKVYGNDEFTGKVVDSVDFSAINVHVGNAAQTQVGGSVRYNTPVKGLYIKPRFIYFARNYASFDATTLTGLNKDRESWKMPNYSLVDLYVGYEFKVWKMKMNANIGCVNLMNTIYISDALNGAKFDATTTTVFMGLGRRLSASLKIGF